MKLLQANKLGPSGFRFMFNTKTIQFVLKGTSGSVTADIEVANNRNYFCKAGTVELSLSKPGYYSEGIYSDEFKGWKYIRINIKKFTGSGTLVAYTG